MSEELGDADRALAMHFRGEYFGNAPVIGVIRIDGENPGNAVPASVCGCQVMGMQALGQEQVGLNLMEKLEGLGTVNPVALNGPSTRP